MIEVTFKLDIQEYTKLILVLLYTRMRTLVIALFGLFILLLAIVDLLFSLHLFTSVHYDIYFLTIGFFIVCVKPIWTRYRIKKTFQSNKKMGETITYSFDDAKYRINGESFSSEITWNTLYEVFESKKYFLLFHSRQSAHIVPKRVFQPEQIGQLRSMIEAVPGIRKRLMKD